MLPAGKVRAVRTKRVEPVGWGQIEMSGLERQREGWNASRRQLPCFGPRAHSHPILRSLSLFAVFCVIRRHLPALLNPE